MAAPKYRHPHQQLRAVLIRRFVPGTICKQLVNGVICGQPMYAGQQLDLGHDERGGYIGLVHARCNRQAGAINSNRGIVRKTIKRITSSGRPW